MKYNNIYGSDNNLYNTMTFANNILLEKQTIVFVHEDLKILLIITSKFYLVRWLIGVLDNIF